MFWSKSTVVSSLFVSCATFAFFWNILVLDSRFVVSVLMALLVLMMSIFMATSSNPSLRISIGRRSLETLYLTLYLLSIAIVLLSPKQTTLVADWSNISPWSWLRLIPSILICNFLPGYAMLRILGASNEISFVGKICLSFVLSLFISSLLANTFIMFGFNFSNFGLILLSMNIVLLFVDVLKRNAQKSTGPGGVSFNPILAVIIGLIGSVLAYNYFLVNFTYTGFIKNDSLFSFGGSLRLMKPNPGESLILSAYPTWDRLFLAANLEISGFPLLNFVTMLSFTPILLLPAFLFLSKTFFKHDDKALICSTLAFTILSGFEWIYPLFIRIVEGPQVVNSEWLFQAIFDVRNQTLIISNMVNYSWELRASSLSLIVFVILLALVLNEEIRLRHRCWLLSVCWAAGYLLHIHEAFIFLIVCLPWTLYPVGSRRKSSNALALSIILGIALSTLMSFGYPSGIYGGLPTAATISFWFLYLAISNLKMIESIFRILVSFLRKHYSLVRMVVLPSLLYLYIHSVLLYSVTSNQIEELAVYHVGFFPWSIFPVRFGLLLLVPLIGFCLFERGYSSKLLVLIPIIVMSFSVTGLFDFLNSQRFFVIPFNYTKSTSGLPAYRVANLLVVPLAILCGHFIVVMSERIKSSRRELMAFFICGIVILGSTSTLISAEWWSIHGGWWASFKIGPPVSQEELEAIDWLRKNTVTIDSVAAFSPRSSISVLVSGAKQTLSFDAFNRLAMTDVLLSSRDPVFIMQFLSSRKIDYIYLSSEDVDIIEANTKYRSGFFNSLLPLLNIVFKNSKISIYSLPNWTPPSSDSNTILLVPGQYDAVSSLILYSMAEARMNFRTLWRGDGSQFDSSVMILPQDPVMELIPTKSLEGWQLQGFGDRLEVGQRELGELTLDWSIDLTSLGNHSLNYTMGKPVDCRRRFFSILMHGDGSNSAFKVLLRDMNGSVAVLKEGNIWWNGWKRFKLKVGSTMQEDIDLDKVIGLGIIYLVKERREGTTMIRLSDIVLSEEMESLQTIYGHSGEAEQLEWIRNGGRLIVLGSSEKGYFANTLSIEKTGEAEVSAIRVANSSFNIPEMAVSVLESRDKDVKTHGLYLGSGLSMPSVFRKSIGLGELVFVNIQPILDILERGEEAAQITKMLIPTLKSLELQPLAKIGNGTSHVTFADSVSFQGNLNATTRLFVPMSGDLILDELKMIDVNTTRTYRDVTLQEVRIRGHSISTISTTAAITSEAAFTGHTVLTFPEGFEWSLRAGRGMTGYIMFESGNEATTITLEGKDIDLKTSRRVKGIMENPKIDANGRINIARAYFEPPENVINGVQLLAGEYGRPLTFLGRLSYTSSIAVSGIALVDYLTFQGTINFSRYENSFGDINAAWWRSLLSPVGMGGLAFFITVSLLISQARTLRRSRRI